MPIITTPGQDDSNSTVTTTPPSIPSRIHSTVNTPYTTVPVAPVMPQPVENANNDDIDDDFFNEPEEPAAAKKPVQAQPALSRMTEDQRRTAIITAFNLVLGREPTDRDFSYYRFSTLSEEGLIRSLLSLPEHKQMVDKSKEYPTLKQSVMDLDLRVKQMDSSVLSMQQELIALQMLLNEKNRYIQQMRGLPVSPQEEYQNQPNQPQQQVQQPATVLGVEKQQLPTPLDEIKSLFRSVFGRKQ